MVCGTCIVYVGVLSRQLMSIKTSLGALSGLTLLFAGLFLASLAMWAMQLTDPDFLAAYSVRAVVLSIGTLLLVWLLSVGMQWFGETIQAGRFAWQQRLHQYLDVEEGKRIHEVDWIGVVLHLLLWSLMPLLILHFWGLSDTSWQLLSKFAMTGFNVTTNLKIVPGQILLGVVVFAVLITFIRWLAGRLEHKWLARTPLEAHTREAVATLFAYAAFISAGLVGLNYAGFDLTKLAIIAGALSVGIGFGLQNVVNNFVSGIILLFERPIRTGDYVTVNMTEGYVRRMRIRSTEIETLDRMSVIVPNSELLMNHVKNWNLRDHYGRVTASVGVAYGSDTKLVEKLLLEVAQTHPLIIKKGEANVPGPIVFFTGFGDNSLDFQLKVFVRQIAMRYVVISDLNFAIDAIFREHNVAIPFPQRDLWFRNAPAGSETETQTDTLSDPTDAHGPAA